MLARSWFVAPLLAAAGLVSSWSAPAPVPVAPPIPGPGAVLKVAGDLLQAIERGDRDALPKLFVGVDEHRGLLLQRHGDGELVPVDGEPPVLTFREVGRGDEVLLASDPIQATKLLIATYGVGDAVVTHRIVAVHADCPAAGCSWAAVDFDRTVRRGDEVATLPLRAMVLARWDQGANGMRVFGWHAARR